MFELGIAEYWPLVLVVLTALGTYGYSHGAIAWYRARWHESAETVRMLLAENRRLRRVLSAVNGETDE